MAIRKSVILIILLGIFSFSFAGVQAAQFSPPQQTILAQSGGLTDRDYEPITLDTVSQITELTRVQAQAGLSDINWSPNGTTFGVSGFGSTVLAYRTFTLNEPPVPLIGESQNALMLAVRISPDNRRIAAGGADNLITIWNLTTGELEHTLEHSNWVWALDFHPEGDVLVAADQDGNLIQWDVETGERIERFSATHEDTVTGIAFSPDGERIASSSLDRTARVWDAATGEELVVLEGHEQGVADVAFSPDGSKLATGSGDTTVRVWDSETGEMLTVLEGHTGGISSVSFNNDGTVLASVGQDAIVRLWDVETGEALAALNGHGGWVQGVAFNHDGTLLASCDFNGVIIIWGISE